MAIYDEAKPYIFISYSHRDSEKVIEIMNFLREEGFNLWYDDGIDPGTEWDENIANHIIHCSYFIAFVSNGYINSKNCRDELNFSRDRDKEQLLIYLEDVTLPSGMAMRMSRLQAIYWHKYKKDVREAYEKLLLAKGIEKCRISAASHSHSYSHNQSHSTNPVPQQAVPGKNSNLLFPVILLAVGIVIIVLLVILLLQNQGAKERIPSPDELRQPPVTSTEETKALTEETVASKEESTEQAEEKPVDSYEDEAQLGTLSTRQLLEKAKDYTDAGDYDKALPYFEKAASRYDGEALRWLGIIYQAGHSSEGVNEKKAIDYYIRYQEVSIRSEDNDGVIKANEALDSFSPLTVALAYVDKKDYDLALYYFQQAAGQDMVEAYRWMGTIYSKGLSEKGVDIERAIQYYEYAIERGDYESLNLLGTLYEEQGNEGDAEYYFRLYKEVSENSN